MKKRTPTKIFAFGAAAALALSACGNDDAGGDGGSNGGGESKEITIGMFNWDEAIAVSHLWEHILEEKGYDVTLESVDPGAAFLSLSTGDVDALLDVWEPVTHAEYLDSYGDDIEKLGVWYEDAKLAIAVNEDAPIDSIDELADNADLFNNRIVGIEPGAGLTALTEEEVIPTYGLEDFDFVTSSTPAMLSELKTATDNGENIVVTLWSPHWAYEAFPVKDLEDPEGTLGAAETLSSYGSSTFKDDQPEVAEWLSNFTMSPEQLADLENKMLNENEDPNNYPEIIEQWVADNQEYVDSLTAEGGDTPEDTESSESAE
ncbi:glycine betaine ABC transporter substrate-binding protein [Actinomycetaceae bacterium L2_0104]